MTPTYYAVIALGTGATIYPRERDNGRCEVSAAISLIPGTVHGTGSTREAAIEAARANREEVLKGMGREVRT